MYAPTSQHSLANETQYPLLKSYHARPFNFTKAIDKALMDVIGDQRLVVSLRLDGVACCAELVKAWLRRPPEFTWIIRDIFSPKSSPTFLYLLSLKRLT
jgi:hypothetical protein